LRGHTKYSVSGLLLPRAYTWSTPTAMFLSIHRKTSLYSGRGVSSSSLLLNQSVVVASQSCRQQQ
jgi:hypothetical protein